MFSPISYYADVRFNYLGYYQIPAVANSAGSELNTSLDGSRAIS